MQQPDKFDGILLNFALFLSFTSAKNKLPLQNAWKTWLDNFTDTSQPSIASCVFLCATKCFSLLFS